MKRVLLSSLLVILAGCGVAPLEHSLDLGASQARLAVTSPGLIEPLKSFVALMYFNPDGAASCADLVDASLLDLDTRAPIASQVISLEGDGKSDEHAFGNVGESGPHSFLLLGSLKPKGLLKFEVEGPDGEPTSSNALVEGQGSVIAIGCEEVDVRQYQRFDVPISLFPAGLR